MAATRAPWLRRGAWVLAFAALFFGLRAWQQRDLIAGTAPPLPPALAGTAAPPPGRAATVVYFWAGWCPVCRLEHGAVSALARDGRIVTVAMQSGVDADVRRYLESEKLAWPVVNDPEGRIAAAWRVRATPTFFVVDAQGRIRFREVGLTSETGLRLRLWLSDAT
jgi:thiol-disulfide isomerase/thioredoxin